MLWQSMSLPTCGVYMLGPQHWWRAVFLSGVVAQKWESAPRHKCCRPKSFVGRNDWRNRKTTWRRGPVATHAGVGEPPSSALLVSVMWYDVAGSDGLLCTLLAFAPSFLRGLCFALCLSCG